eukprot:6214573-Pleurochrysis_carterae.AAC.1
MHPALAQAYHHNCTISLIGMPSSNVGYDMFIEKENLAIAMDVLSASHESITKYVIELNFTGPVTHAAERKLIEGK